MVYTGTMKPGAMLTDKTGNNMAAMGGKTLDHVVVEAVYSRVCAGDTEGVLRSRLIEEILPVYGINEMMLDDILFYLRHFRGVYSARSHGLFRDRETYSRRVFRY